MPVIIGFSEWAIHKRMQVYPWASAGNPYRSNGKVAEIQRHETLEV